MTDMTMPHMTGNKLAQGILNIRHDIPIILCTGYSQKMSAERVQKLGIRKYIGKTVHDITPSELAQRLAEKDDALIRNQGKQR
ncbi:MAG TPA: response regulator [Deltaproteobacteria bacterium]|nr:response regulator [Deltaproteobacteria bacterium]